MTTMETLPTETMEIVRVQDLDAFIEHHLGRAWSCQQNGDMLSNDTLHLFDVYPDPDATALVQAWLDSPVVAFPGRTTDQLSHPSWGDYPSDATCSESVPIYTAYILSELCNRGLLQEGYLHLYVSW